MNRDEFPGRPSPAYDRSRWYSETGWTTSFTQMRDVDENFIVADLKGQGDWISVKFENGVETTGFGRLRVLREVGEGHYSKVELPWFGIAVVTSEGKQSESGQLKQTKQSTKSKKALLTSSRLRHTSPDRDPSQSP